MPLDMFDIMHGTWTLFAWSAARSIGLQKNFSLSTKKFANFECVV